jgi:GNAT superfamily N-acetyltransferase
METFIHRSAVDGLEEYDLVVNDVVVSTITYAVLPVGEEQPTVIDLLYTPEEYRGKGYAGKLLKYLLRQLRDPVYLFVKGGTFVGDFYQRYGFSPIEIFGCYRLMAHSSKTREELKELWLRTSSILEERSKTIEEL